MLEQLRNVAAPVLLATLLCGPSFSTAASDDASPPPAGRYTLDRTHASLVLRVDHLGLSMYTLRFTGLDATLDFDPADLARSRVEATIDARTIETDYPDPARVDFDAMLQDERWLDTARFPRMTYRSTAVRVVAPNRLRIEGELTLRGVTRAVPLEATYNGGYARHPLDARSQIGFSAHGVLKRSEFGINFALPPPDSKFGVGDNVAFSLELEFSRPIDTPPR